MIPHGKWCLKKPPDLYSAISPSGSFYNLFFGWSCYSGDTGCCALVVVRLVVLDLQISFLSILGILLVGIVLACLIGLFEESCLEVSLWVTKETRWETDSYSDFQRVIQQPMHFLKPTGELELPVNWLAGFICLEQSIGYMILLHQDWDARLG